MAKLRHLIKYGNTRSKIEKQLDTVWFLGKRITVHKKIVPALHGAQTYIRRYEKNHKKKAYIAPTAGGYCWRKMRNSNSLSEHALGVAVDIDWERNPMVSSGKRYKCKIPDYVITGMKTHGFEWGGDWKKPFDPMHFQIK